jgi:hypothetical protein
MEAVLGKRARAQHAEQPPAPHEGAAFFSGLLESPDVDEGVDDDALSLDLLSVDFAAGFDPLFLKSVAYQPLPFR